MGYNYGRQGQQRDASGVDGSAAPTLILPAFGGVGLENLFFTCTCGYESAGEREGENNHAQTKRIYLNRAFGGDRYYCVVDGDLDAGTATGKGAG